MNSNSKTKIIVTLGPATRTEEDLRKIKDRGASFVRINMSHSSIDDLRYFIALAKKVDIPFIIDTEGSQIRTGDLDEDKVTIAENAEVKIYDKPIIGNASKINLRPLGVINQLERGDIIHVDFDSLILRVSDITTIKDGYIVARAVSGGILGNNKAVAIDPGMHKYFDLPALSKKDYESIQVGLDEGIEHIAASFMRSKEFVEEVRNATQGKMKIISKIECVDALENLDEIIDASDYLLLDRGDLSKEIPIERIPLTQKIVLARAAKKSKGVFVATNLLESMIQNKKPTRAEVNDVITTILDGAIGLTMSAETAIGKYPIACINMLNKLIEQAEVAKDANNFDNSDHPIIDNLESVDYLLNTDSNAGLIAPHGGSLVDRVIREIPDDEYIKSLPKITLDQDKQMDVEQIAIGTFSPIEGFMGKEDFNGVLDNMRLANGEVWTIPIVLDVAKDFSDIVQVGNDIALWDDEGPMGLLHLEEKYEFDKDETNQKLYGTTSEDHPGVKWINNMQPVLLGGKISLLRRRTSEHKEYELTPRQVRRMFHEKGWSKIVGFHTRNVIHRSHEFIQLDAMARGNCDGLFVHPVIGKKKPGDFHAKYIINGYEQMVSDFYPKDKVVFATYATFSRYAGPREAIFTALCRKNFGCSHFVVGRDHTGVGNFYHPKAAHEIFDKFDDLDIRPVRFDQIFYSKKLNQHVHEADDSDHTEEEKMHISGTQARKMIEKGEQPPEWFMRPEISQMILNASNSGEEVFVSEKEDNNQGNVLWFTGLSGSGKTTIAQELKKSLEAQGKSVAMLDGDDVRNSRKVKLGFSREDIRENNKIIAEMAKEKSLDHDFVIVPIISPYQEDRNMVRTMIGNNYYSVYINASLDTCIKRDVKGLYSRALKGEIDNFIGISPSNPYETPQESDLVVDTAIHEPIASTQRIVEFLKQKNLLQMKLPNSSFSPEMSTAINAAFKAGEQVMQIYNTQFSYTLKDGKEPVTEADIASDKIIHMLLSSTGIPILSEETQDTGERLNQNQVWIVDPLDGTKDFVTKTGEFSIMIALVNNGVPEIGVVYNPVKDILYIAQLGKGAFKRENGDWQKMSVNNHDDLQKAKAVVSRHHLTDKEESFLNRLGVSDFVQKGSAGLKIAEVAVGKAELYFTMSDKLQEWDTAAAYCILIEAQGTMTDMLGNKLAYNQSDLYHKRGILVTNALLHNSVVEMQAVYR